jgi:hypothetical protein
MTGVELGDGRYAQAYNDAYGRCRRAIAGSLLRDLQGYGQVQQAITRQCAEQ